MTNSGTRWSARRLARGRPAALLLVLAVAAGIGARIAVQSASPVFASDSFQNLLIARSLADGHGFASSGAEHPDLSRSVLFPAAIAAATTITGDVERGARVVVLLAGSLIVLPMFFLSRSAFGPRAALAALPLGALSCGIGASARFLATSLYLLLVLTAVAMAWSAARKRSAARWLMAGAFAGLSALARPEGIVIPVVVAAWAAIGEGRRPRDRRGLVRRRLVCVALASAASFGLYAPYVMWASLKLGRFLPSPGIEYVRAERRVSDHLQLRESRSGVSWTSRARFMLTENHRALYLETYFLTGSFPSPDIEAKGDPAVRSVERGTSDSGRAVPWRHVLQRRWYILRGNLLLAPRKAAWGHFLPLVVVGLASIGVVGSIRTARTREALFLLTITGIASLAPLASHIEDRFFYVPFALATVLSASGWGAISSVMARAERPSCLGRTGRIAVDVGLFAAVAWAGARHEGSRPDALARASLLRGVVPGAIASTAPGPVLAIEPHSPYWSGRPYRPIPFATPEGILDYARAQGAGALVLEGARDLAERPDLTWLTAEAVPAPYRLLLSVPHPSGGSLLVYTIDQEATQDRDGPSAAAPGVGHDVCSEITGM